MPSSMTSVPASARARTNFSVAASEGSPAVMYATIPSSPDSRSAANRLEIRVELEVAKGIVFQQRLEQAGIRVHVFVATARKVEDDQVVGGHFGNAFDQTCNGVRGFERRDDAFDARKKARCIERGRIRNRGILGAAFIGEPRVLRANGRIVETSGNGMRGGNLPVFGLQNVRVGSLQDA